MGSKVFVVLFLVFLAVSFTAIADKSKDEKNLDAVKEAASEKDQVVEPQQRGGCRRGCCGSYAHGQCSFCCPPKAAAAEKAATGVEGNKQRGGCRHGCCGSYAYGQCSYCCPTAAAAAAKAAAGVEGKKQRGGCRKGCCGSYAYGQCSYCCP